MKYSDYNLVKLEFVQKDLTTFGTKDYTKVEFDAIMTKLKKSNIIMATVTPQNGVSFLKVGCIQGYDRSGNPEYSFVSNNVTFVLQVSEVNNGTGIIKYNFYFNAVQ